MDSYVGIHYALINDDISHGWFNHVNLFKISQLIIYTYTINNKLVCILIWNTVY